MTLGDCEKFYSECNKKCATTDDKSQCYKVCSDIYYQCATRNTVFISAQLSKQVASAAQGASTSTTFTLTGQKDNMILIKATLIASAGFAGYTVEAGDGTGSWTINAAKASNGTAGSYTFIHEGPTTGIEPLSKQIDSWFSDIACQGSLGETYTLDAVTTLGKTVSSDSIPYQSSLGPVETNDIIEELLDSTKTISISALNYQDFVNKVVNAAIPQARRNASGVQMTIYPYNMGQGDTGGLVLRSTGAFGYANSKTGSGDGYGQLSGTATGINGAVNYITIASDSEAEFANEMTAALTGPIYIGSTAKFGTLALVTVGDTCQSYIWTASASGQ